MSTLKAIDSLVEIRLWDLEVSTVSDGLDGEDEGLSSEHSELTHHLPWMGHKQADGFLLVNHPLVDMQTARQDKVQTYILKRWKEEEIEITEREKDTNNFAVLPDRFFFCSDSVTLFIIFHYYTCYYYYWSSKAKHRTRLSQNWGKTWTWLFDICFTI